MGLKRRNERYIKVGVRGWMGAMIDAIAERDDVTISVIVRNALEKTYPDEVRKYRDWKTESVTENVDTAMSKEDIAAKYGIAVDDLDDFDDIDDEDWDDDDK